MRGFMTEYLRNRATSHVPAPEVSHTKPTKTPSAAVMNELQAIMTRTKNGRHTHRFKADHEYSNHNHRTERAKVKSHHEIRLNSPVLSEDDVESHLEWRINFARNPASCPFPALIPLALELFSCPVMSSECERMFSQSTRTITDGRNCLGAEVIEARECQKNWLDNGLVHSHLNEAIKRLNNGLDHNSEHVRLRLRLVSLPITALLLYISFRDREPRSVRHAHQAK